MNASQIPENAPNLYMVGFMGTGKSAIGSKVAQHLNMPFMDSDHFIEESEAMSIPKIFDTFGEAHFRQLERRFIEQDQPKNGAVISCGGGLVTNLELLSHIKKVGIVVVLYASVDTIYSRIAHDSHRPLMKVSDPRKKIETLLSEREPIYKEAGIGIMTDGYSIHEVVEKVTRVYLDHLD